MIWQKFSSSQHSLFYYINLKMRLVFFFFFFEQDETRFGRGKGVEGNHHFQINISKEKLQKIHKTCKNFTNILLSTY